MMVEIRGSSGEWWKLSRNVGKGVAGPHNNIICELGLTVWNETWFFESKREWGGRGVKEKNPNRVLADPGYQEKQSSMTDKEKSGVASSANKDGVAPSVTVAYDNTQMYLNDGHGTTPAGNTPGKFAYANVIGESSKKAVNIRTLFTPRGTGLTLLYQWSRSELLAKGTLGWNPNVNLLKEDVGNVPVWVKLYGVPVMMFSEDSLSAIATKLGTPLMLDSYTSDMACNHGAYIWPYSRGMSQEYWIGCDKEIEEALSNFSWCFGWSESGFKPHKEYRPVLKKTTASPGGNKKKGVKHTNEASNLNPFDVLNSADNDVEFGTNGGTTNLVNDEANSSGSSFMNVESTSNTPIIDKIRKFKDLLIDGQAILMDEADNPLKKVECPGDYDSEDEVASVDNDMTRSLASERVGFGTQSLLEQ
uniref:Uncharacterized protein n=1 Tax=Tanacetum cinerariifolium TaxID=118510 RepID=A0A6L2M0H7_TANCI|nr:hypothetical protein [Tanacetum cinerariifolium]